MSKKRSAEDSLQHDDQITKTYGTFQVHNKRVKSDIIEDAGKESSAEGQRRGDGLAHPPQAKPRIVVPRYPGRRTLPTTVAEQTTDLAAKNPKITPQPHKTDLENEMEEADREELVYEKIPAEQPRRRCSDDEYEDEEEFYGFSDDEEDNDDGDEDQSEVVETYVTDHYITGKRSKAERVLDSLRTISQVLSPTRIDHILDYDLRPKVRFEGRPTSQPAEVEKWPRSLLRAFALLVTAHHIVPRRMNRALKGKVARRNEREGRPEYAREYTVRAGEVLAYLDDLNTSHGGVAYSKKGDNI